MYRGDQNFIGGLGIGGIDMALNNLAPRLTDIGSRQERAMVTWQRLNDEIPNIEAMLAREASVNMITAATELSMMQFAHTATLQTAAKIIPPTLLDFLR
jgi:flagellar hook-associated protein 3 FlgL